MYKLKLSLYIINYYKFKLCEEKNSERVKKIRLKTGKNKSVKNKISSKIEN